MLKRNHTLTGYLAKRDVDTIVSQSASLLTDSFLGPNEKLISSEKEQLGRALTEILSTDAMSSSHLTPDAWNAVFWEPSWARPDKVTRALNLLLIERDSQTFYINSRIFKRGKRSTDVNTLRETLQVMIMSLGYLPNPPKAGQQLGKGDMSLVNKTTVLDFVSANHDKVEWKGNSFGVKEMSLYKVILADFAPNDNMGVISIGVKR